MRTYFSNIFVTLGFLSIIALGTFAITTLPTPAQAVCTEDTDSGQYCLLEPIPLGDGQVYDKYDPAKTNIADYINLAIKIFISIIGGLGVVMIVIGGVQYMTTDAVSKKEGGKEMISNSIFGVILALFSWIILNTINPSLLDIRVDPPKGISVQVSGTDELPAPTKNRSTTINGQNVTVTTNCDQTSVNAVAEDGIALNTGQNWGGLSKINDNDADYRRKLEEVGVLVNKSNCATVGQSDCTTVYKLGALTVSSLADLRKDVCKESATCKLTLTGGTECWLHSSHQIGSGKVDLSPNGTPSLDSYIKGLATKKCVDWITGQSGDGCPSGQAGQYTIGTAVFIRESNHWHVAHW